MTDALHEAFRERMVAAVRFFAAAPDDSSARRELASLLAYGPGASALLDEVVAGLVGDGSVPRASLVSLRAFAIHVQHTSAGRAVSPAWLDIPPHESRVDETVLRGSEERPASVPEATAEETSEDSADLDLPKGTLCANRYIVDEAVAVGGMSTVYRTTDCRDGRVVALKVLRRSMANEPEMVAAFEREADNAWTLRHPGFVRVLAQGRIGDQPFLALEYLEGQSLGAAQIVHDDPPLDSERDGDAGGGALTPAYASPEMLLGASAAARDDVFSLAVIGYELVAGRHPFDRHTADRARHLDLRPARPPGLPAYAWRTLRRGLSLRRDRRPTTMAGFVAGLQRPFPTTTVTTGLVALAILAGLTAWIHWHPDETQAHWDTGRHAVGLAVDLARLRPLPDRPAESLTLAQRVAEAAGWEAPRAALVERLSERLAPSALAPSALADADTVERAVGAFVTLRPLGLSGPDAAGSMLAVTNAIAARLADLVQNSRPLAVDAINRQLVLLWEVDPDAVRVVAPHLTGLLNRRRHAIVSDAERAEFDRLSRTLVERFPILPPPVGGSS